MLAHNENWDFRAERDPYSAYQLQRGRRLPPLMFMDAEAIAMILGSLVTLPICLFYPVLVYHFFKIAIAQPIAYILAHAQHNDFALMMSPFPTGAESRVFSTALTTFTNFCDRA